MRRIAISMIIAALIAGLGLTACGRKGDLKPPPGYDRETPAEEDE